MRHFDSQNLLTATESVEIDKGHPQLAAAERTRHQNCNNSSSLNMFETKILKALSAQARGIPRHDRLFRKHDMFDRLYVIRFGQFKLIGNDSRGHQRVIGFHMAGDWIGLDAIASGLHDFGAIALEDSEVWEIPFSAASKTMASQPEIQRQFFETMSAALKNQYRHSLLVGASIEARFASFLLALGDKFKYIGYSNSVFRLSMSRSDIGSYLGTTVESVSRVIARLNSEGGVTIRGRDVVVHDITFLEAIIDGFRRDSKRMAVH